ncbi:hypothetical protein Hamer_G030950 [Homarus americanus]|uniref:Uncharacterized protein n=1 Tax=Homarus americanus TaxID=6706 RepID=A0A8J5KDD0_HOMAM|nr:hypothetical protein Hamer_G030950 [Homarus americanus]
MEEEDIVAARNKYLRYIQKNRESSNPRPEVYLDETWINQNQCVERCWTVNDGSAGRQGFIPGALLMFRSKNGAKGDYNDSMDHERFKAWFKEQLLQNIQGGC